MGCNPQSFKGLARNCSENNGGVSVLYVGNRDSFSVTYDSTGTAVSEIVALDTEKLRPFNFKKGAASFTSSMSADPSVGSEFWDTKLNVNFAKADIEKWAEINKLVHADIIAVVRDNNGTYWLIGDDDTVYATSAVISTGQNRGDANQYTVELSEERGTMPRILDEDGVASLADVIGPVL